MIREHRLAFVLLLFTCRLGLGADELKNSDTLIDRYIKQHNRASLAADADMLAKQTLSLQQIERIIATDQKESIPARRLMHWRVLHEAQAPTAHDYLQTALLKADPGQAIEFVHSLRFLRGQDIPLLTALYKHTTSDLLQTTLVSIAQTEPRGLTGRDILLAEPSSGDRAARDAFGDKFREYEQLAAKAIFLYQQWLIANGKSIEHRRTAYASVSPYKESFLTDALQRETDADVRRTIYEVLVEHRPGVELLRLLDSDEPEATKLACMELSLLKIREYKTRRGAPPHFTVGLPGTLSEMELGSPALEKVKVELMEASSVSRQKP